MCGSVPTGGGDFLDCVVGGFFVEINDAESGAGGGKSEGDGAADAAAGSGNGGDFSVEAK